MGAGFIEAKNNRSNEPQNAIGIETIIWKRRREDHSIVNGLVDGLVDGETIDEDRLYEADASGFGRENTIMGSPCYTWLCIKVTCCTPVERLLRYNRWYTFTYLEPLWGSE